MSVDATMVGMSRRFADTCLQCGRTRVYSFTGVCVEPCGCNGRGQPRVFVPRWAEERLRPARPSRAHSGREQTREGRTAPGSRSRFAWKRAYATGAMECHYCRATFTDALPPTIEHVKPQSQGGGNGPTVLACLPCNTARSSAPYHDYAAAVERAHDEANRTGDPYRRPTWYVGKQGASIR